jgi:Arc/MetJ family transcription regulator
MRTNIDIDDKLMKQAMKATGAATKKAAVEMALKRLVEIRRGEAARRLEKRKRLGTNAVSSEDDWLEKWLASDQG